MMKNLIVFVMVLIMTHCVTAGLVYLDWFDYEESSNFSLPTLSDTESGDFISLHGERTFNQVDIIWVTNLFGTTTTDFDGVPGNYLYDSAQMGLDYCNIEYGTDAFTDFVEFYSSLLTYIQDSGKIGAVDIVGDLLMDNDSDGIINFADTDYNVPEPASLLLLASGFFFMRKIKH